MLSQLPPPPSGKSGWPWTEESEVLPPIQSNKQLWTRISIVTPSYNQGEFIEETIRSLILQNYPNFEYIIIDGGSTDKTLEIIRKYEKWIEYWVSEKDNGQSHAINKGFAKCTGEFVNWICSDDMLCKNALFYLSPFLNDNKNSLIISHGLRIDQNSNIIDEILPSVINNFENLVDIKQYWRRNNSIMQQSCFYPLKELKRFELLNVSNHYTMDYELWGRLLIADIQIVRTSVMVGLFRWYGGQKTSNQNTVTNSLITTALRLIMSNKNLSVLMKIPMVFKVVEYYGLYYYHFLRSKIGLRRRIKFLLYGNSDPLYK